MFHFNDAHRSLYTSGTPTCWSVKRLQSAGANYPRLYPANLQTFRVLLDNACLYASTEGSVYEQRLSGNRPYASHAVAFPLYVQEFTRITTRCDARERG